MVSKLIVLFLIYCSLSWALEVSFSDVPFRVQQTEGQTHVYFKLHAARYVLNRSSPFYEDIFTKIKEAQEGSRQIEIVADPYSMEIIRVIEK